MPRRPTARVYGEARGGARGGHPADRHQCVGPGQRSGDRAPGRRGRAARPLHQVDRRPDHPAHRQCRAVRFGRRLRLRAAPVVRVRPGPPGRRNRPRPRPPPRRRRARRPPASLRPVRGRRAAVRRRHRHRRRHRPRRARRSPRCAPARHRRPPHRRLDGRDGSAAGTGRQDQMYSSAIAPSRHLATVTMRPPPSNSPTTQVHSPDPNLSGWDVMRGGVPPADST